MNQDTFIDLLEVAYDDFKSQNSDDTMIGMIVITVHVNGPGEGEDVGIQMGANVEPDIVDYVINRLKNSGRHMEHIPTKARRTV